MAKAAKKKTAKKAAAKAAAKKTTKKANARLTRADRELLCQLVGGPLVFKIIFDKERRRKLRAYLKGARCPGEETVGALPLQLPAT